jgi:hypothetical protein
MVFRLQLARTVGALPRPPDDMWEYERPAGHLRAAE